MTPSATTRITTVATEQNNTVTALLSVVTVLACTPASHDTAKQPSLDGDRE